MYLLLPNSNKYYLFRDMLAKMIITAKETDNVYVILNSNENLISITRDLKDLLFYNDKTKIYKSTLKNAYIYFLISEYQSLPVELLVLHANLAIRKITPLELQTILNVSKESLNKLLIGMSDFKGPYSFENLSQKLLINIKEFNFKFKECFERIR